jgi:hypothetical protein
MTEQFKDYQRIQFETWERKAVACQSRREPKPVYGHHAYDVNGVKKWKCSINNYGPCQFSAADCFLVHWGLI